MKLQVVVGGQFGSEAKGHVTRQLVDQAVADGRKVVNIRVAGPNAGHCAIDDTGRKWALRQVPVGVTNPHDNVTLYIAAGSEIDLPVLLQEIHDLNEAGLRASSRLVVDPEATMLYEEHKRAETGMHEKIGSTGKGIGAARADRIMRTANRLCDDAEAVRYLTDLGVIIGHLTVEGLTRNYQHPAVIIEGTQGYGLGMNAGFYPQCTSSNTRAIDFLAMAGISPWHRKVTEFEVWVVARVYPIRVAGNSGPLAGETSWEDLGLPEERTTVTHKVRRVGQWDRDLIAAAVAANGGAPVVRLAVTMLDQKFDWTEGRYGDYYLDLADSDDVTPEQFEALSDFLAEVESDANAPVRMITTSPTHAIWREEIL